MNFAVVATGDDMAVWRHRDGRRALRVLVIEPVRSRAVFELRPQHLHLPAVVWPRQERETRRVAERAAHQRHARDVVDQRQTTQDLGKLVTREDGGSHRKANVGQALRNALNAVGDDRIVHRQFRTQPRDYVVVRGGLWRRRKRHEVASRLEPQRGEASQAEHPSTRRDTTRAWRCAGALRVRLDVSHNTPNF